MSGSIFKLSSIETFGDVAAEEDLVLDYFLFTNAVESISKGKSFLVLGRKGTGKTAIVRHFTERSQGRFSKALNLRGYPWNVHAQIVDHGASDIEAYVASWKYIVAVEISALVLSHPSVSLSIDAPLLRTFLIDNYGGTSPQLSDILRPKKLKLSKASFQPAIMGNQIGGIELSRTGKDHQLGLELSALTNAIMACVQKVIREAKISSLSLHFDELDQGLSRLDESRTKMLVGLILAVRELRIENKKSGSPIDLIVYLRSDIWEDMQFSDKNKISQGLSLSLEWNPESLLQLIEARIHAKTGSTLGWHGLIDEVLMRGSQSKWNHILARTFLRPRDVIRFLNTALITAKKRDTNAEKFTNKDIVKSRDEYSSYLKSELDDEIRPHWPYWDEALQACSAISTLTFDVEQFEREYKRRKSPKNETDFREALAYLYRFSVLGYEKRSGYGGRTWAFQYTDPEAGWDNAATQFKVHLGLKEYAKLREERQPY
ncbi:P-loop ATPase, Sll1717 family [Lichenibacterium ramalinae]|uniref:P-loop ATPase, Sll1717 family n=1 Tax=Lichenibacterium ramalinae TaxID=2316527 RepID=UPI00100FEE47|nr:hypothetical protein [Lichenibacterium ramalinae]